MAIPNVFIVVIKGKVQLYNNNNNNNNEDNVCYVSVSLHTTEVTFHDFVCTENTKSYYNLGGNWQQTLNPVVVSGLSLTNNFNPLV